MKKLHRFLPLLLLVFYLGTYGGKVALFRGNSKKPMKVFPYSVSTLPADARAALDKRIPVKSREDLVKLIETYLS